MLSGVNSPTSSSYRGDTIPEKSRFTIPVFGELRHLYPPTDVMRHESHYGKKKGQIGHGRESCDVNEGLCLLLEWDW